MSAVPEFTTYFCWGWWTANNNDPQGSPVWSRVDDGPWEPYDTGFGDLDADLAFALIGTPAEPDPPQVFVEDGCPSEWAEVDIPDLGPGEGGIPDLVGNVRNSLEDLVVLSPTDIWAVGTYGYQALGSNDGASFALTMHYDGAAWTPVPTPNPPNVLGQREVQLAAGDAVSSDLVYAAGTYTNEVPNSSDTLVMRWEGASWEQLISPGQSGFGASGFLFEAVAAIDADNIWFGGQFADAPGAPEAAMVHYDGSDFTTYLLPRDPAITTGAHRIRAIAALGPDDVWAAGSAGGSAVAVGSSYVAHWDGSSWERIPTPNLGVLEIVRDIVVLAPDDVWISGVYRVIPPKGGPVIPTPLFLHWDGSSWTAVDSPVFARSMAALAPDRIYGVEGEQLAFWDGSEWGLAGDLDEDLVSINVRALAVTGDCELLAVGSTVGSIPDTRAARYRLTPDPADLDGDGVVGNDDLLALLAAWGPCDDDCPADLDGDGAVGLNDLIELLGAWTG